MIQHHIGAAAGARSSCLFIGRDRSGHWVVKDARSLCGGLFTNRTEAIRFAMLECQRRPQSVIMLPDGLELTDRSTKTMPAIRRSGAQRRQDYDRPFEETSKAWLASGSSEAGGRVPTMASLPADEDYARSVLAIFGARGVRPRESLAARDVEAAFLVQNMGRPADFEAALQHAASEGWLTRSLDRIRLTTLGADEMQTIAWPLRGADPLLSGSRILRH